MSELNRYLLGEYRDMMKRAEQLTRYGMSKMPPLIITCAVTGGNQGAEANPNLPETLEDQVQQTYDAYNAGASIVHIHRRDPNNLGYMTKDWKDYLEVNYHVRQRCPDIIINDTVVGGYNIDLATGNLGKPWDTAMQAKPELGSLDIYSLVAKIKLKARKPPLSGRDEDEYLAYNYIIPVETCTEMTKRMIENGIKPEWEIFGVDNLHMLKQMIDAGLAEAPYWMQIAFGPVEIPPCMEKLLDATMTMPDNSLVSVLAVGACQTAMETMAILLGHHVRVGMEDNIYYHHGELAQSNAQQVERIVRIARELGREIATPAEARQMIGLGAPRQYELP